MEIWTSGGRKLIRLVSFPPFKRPSPQASEGQLNSVLFIIALAISWHASLFWLERSRQPCNRKPSFSKLLRLVELDLLSTLRGELVRLLRAKPELKPSYERKLQKISEQLSTLGDRDAP